VVFDVRRPKSQTTAKKVSRPAAPLSDLLAPRLFKALGEPTRIRILQWLASGRDECTVNQVAGACNIGQSLASRHLATLRDAGILESHRRGREVLYRVRVKHLVALLRRLADALESCC
jgi:ArsR family transcriptional regulator